ncbi:MAG: response regulator [Chloroherpetonaceae bacterium]|nr:response regulator [Chloroherpetonaceae bacterium]
MSEKKTLLIVEDEPEVLELLQDAFAESYRIITARNGNEGLDTFLKNQGEIDGIVTDLMMPEMCGDELIQEVRKVNSELPIIMITAFEEKRKDVRKLVKDLNAMFIKKPFSIVEFKRIVMESIH